ncbi:MAG: YunC family protein [Thermoplasmata archaeon]
MIQIETITENERTYTGIKIESVPAPIVIITGKKGFLMCGYLDIQAADRLGSIAASASGINSIDDLLNKEIVKVSAKGKEAGIREGMKGREALTFI